MPQLIFSSDDNFPEIFLRYRTKLKLPNPMFSLVIGRGLGGGVISDIPPGRGMCFPGV